MTWLQNGYTCSIEEAISQRHYGSAIKEHGRLIVLRTQPPGTSGLRL